MNWNKNIYHFCIGALLISTGCHKELEIVEEYISDQTQPEVFNVGSPQAILTDLVRVKFSPQMVERIEKTLSLTEGSLRSTDEDLNELFSGMNALKIHRTFPNAGKFEERQRKAGLHLWYDISINDEVEDTPQRAVQKALNILRGLSDVQVAEEIRVVKTPSTRYTIEPSSIGLRGSVNSSGFNDPDLPKQWHYHNDGSLLRSKAHADINLFEAWKIETGKPNVIVGITDGGIDYLHEDLRDNMHINELELNGSEGVDDDKNGYIDDIYGYNFVLDSGDISFHEHGTHVAGTVAARNNNGIGVAGVAGGDGSPDSGVKLISCQMFHQNEEGRTLSSGGSRAIVYAANNGAVISQNSWGYSDNGLPQTLQQSDKEAIDYFVRYAGCDKDGNQLPDSPMKGGVVIFAAGNDGKDIISYPGAYAEVISVSSMAPDFSMAYYSNRGNWVSVMAPGGSLFYSKGEVLSTLPNNQYGYMQGTSMACPHVSGVAALIVSKYGGQGFTNEDLKQRLKTALLPYDINEHNPQYSKRLGAGYIDAARALSSPQGNVAPEEVHNLSSEATFTGIKLSWDVTKDPNDETAHSYTLYYSSVPIDASNYPKALSLEVTGTRELGHKVHYTHQGLLPNTQYYYAVEAVDRWGARSKTATFATVTTLNNSAPIVTIEDPSTIRLTGKDQATRKILVSEPEGQAWTYAIDGEDYDVKHRRTDKGEIELTFRVSRPIGKYILSLAVTDELGLTTHLPIPFEIYQNHAPNVNKGLDKIILSHGKTKTIDLSNYFGDKDKDELSYTIKVLNPDIVSATVAGGVLTLTPLKEGTAGLSISAVDPSGLGVKAGATIQVVPSGLVQMVYPTLVKDDLNIRITDGINRVYITVLTPSGRPAIEEQTFTLNKEQTIRLDVKDLTAGNYILLVESKDQRFTQSFIKR